MKIAFLIESFLPFSQGGSELSTYYLAKDLARLGHKVTIITPNLGAKPSEAISRIKIIRYPFYLKQSRYYSSPGNFAYNNPLWIIWSAIFIFIYIKREQVDVIHIHGKYSIPPAKLANLFLRKKMVATVRDYQIICNYGFCLYKKDKSCNIIEYFMSDFIYYWNNYVLNKNIFSLFFNLTYAVIGRINRNILNYFARGILLVTLSKKQKNIFEANGFNNIIVIGNSIDFPKEPPKIKKRNQVIYAGRLTPGKGVNLIIDLLPRFFAVFPKYSFVFVGKGFLKEELKKLSKQYKGIKLMEQVNHGKLLALFAESKLTIVPSIWPEPFGRIPMESFSQKTPVIVTNKGGLPEHIKDGKWGYVSEASSKKLLYSIKIALQNNKRLQGNINDD
ncbi:MAG: hypothetical protein ACD_32C00116G0006, partial [uncultured bacterium]